MATRQILADLARDYEAADGTRIDIRSMGGVEAAKLARAHEATDIVVLASKVMGVLETEGHLAKGGTTDFARSEIGVAVRAGLGVPLWTAACRGGAVALGHANGAIAPGCFADLVVVQRDAAALRGHDVDTLMDALIIGGSRADIGDVYVGGERRVHAGVCHGQDESARAFNDAVKRLNEL